MPQEQYLPADVEDLTQEQYEIYIREVKAMLLQTTNRSILLTPESLASVENMEIVSIPQTNGGILVQLRNKTGPLINLLSLITQLSDQDRQLLKDFLNS